MKSSLDDLSSAVDQLEDSDQPPAAESTTDKASFWQRLWQRPSRPPKREDDPYRQLQVTQGSQLTLFQSLCCLYIQSMEGRLGIH
jgi:hypothetical protein